MTYLWERPGWPRLTYREEPVANMVAQLERSRDQLFRHLRFLGFETRQNYFLDSLSGEVVESSLIEHEIFSAPVVRSSIAHKLNLETAGPAARTEKRAEGIIQVLLDATPKLPCSLGRI